jgi:hypothetical protein
MSDMPDIILYYHLSLPADMIKAQDINCMKMNAKGYYNKWIEIRFLNSDNISF